MLGVQKCWESKNDINGRTKLLGGQSHVTKLFICLIGQALFACVDHDWLVFSVHVFVTADFAIALRFRNGIEIESASFLFLSPIY